MKRRIYIFFMVAFLAAGVGVMLYPSISDYVNTYHYEGEADRYVAKTQTLTSSVYGEMIAQARAYNEKLAKFSSIQEAVVAAAQDESDEYDRILSPDGDGVMGIVSIPDKNIYLPVYHGTSEEVLQKGVGHYEGSSLPIGGESTHAVITGHTGLTSAKIFTDIDTMEIGDEFYLYVLGDTLKYEVDQIEVVEPKEVDALSIVDGKDYVTLITCTPYGINSHRLLIRGKRVSYLALAETENWSGSRGMSAETIAVFAVIGGVVIFIIPLGCLAVQRRKAKKK